MWPVAVQKVVLLVRANEGNYNINNKLWALVSFIKVNCNQAQHI